MDFIGRLARFGVPLLGGRSCTAAMIYHMRGISCAIQSIHTQSMVIAIDRNSCRAIHCITTRPNSPWSRTNTATLFHGTNGHGQAQQQSITVPYRSFSQSTTVNISSPAHSVFPRSSPPQAQVPHHRTPYYLSQRRGACPSILLSSPRLFSTTSRTSCSAIIPSSIMTDRDTLPGIFKPSHYDLSISSLNFDDWSYKGQVA